MRTAFTLLFTVLLSVLSLAGIARADAPPLVADAPSYPEPYPDGRSALIAGLMLMEHGDYNGAIPPLNEALKEFPIIGDHILLRLARAHTGNLDIDKSDAAAKKIINKYPKSLVVQDARRLLALNKVARHPEKALASYRGYLRKYPSDEDVRMDYALSLIEAGEINKADEELLKIYVKAGPLAETAYDYMSTSDISRKDLSRRAANLIRNRDFSAAEAILRPLVEDSGEKASVREKNNLARSLFFLRRYKESAPLFLEVGDLYRAARSYIRHGDRKNFYRITDRMYRERDPKTPKIMLAHAGDLRRDGKVYKSRKTIEKVLRTFPKAHKDATWALGWLYYTSGKHKRALEKFSTLADKYGEPRHVYWQARALERTGQDATAIYESIDEPDSYYTYLAGLKLEREPMRADDADDTLDSSVDFTRADLLMDVGLNKEAAKELGALSRRRMKEHDILAVAYRMQKARAYKRAMLLMLKLPEEKREDDIMYPLAYWEDIQEVASKYSLDPLLVLSLIREESRFDCEALSPVGAIGLMQLMPATARDTARRVNVSLNNNKSIYEVENNILLGTYYLKGLLREFKEVPPSLAAYNAGKSRVKQWLSQGKYESMDEFIEDIPFNETRAYVKRILRSLFRYKATHRQEGVSLSLGGL